MPAEKRSHDEMEQAAKQSPPAQTGAAAAAVPKPAADGAAANAGMLGLPFMLPSAALMAMNTVQQADQSTVDDAAAVAALQQHTAAAIAAATASAAQAQADVEQKGDTSAQQQQQLVQQQLQLLQMQQQHLQQMSPGDLSAVATMAHQMALGMVMMPAMMPLMMMNQNGTSSQSDQASPQEEQGSPSRASGELGAAGAADSLGMVGQGGDAAGMPLMGTGAFGNDDTPKRKRGRPPKKDVLARGKPEGMEKALKQFPLWGYGMPLPFLPGFLPPGTGVTADQAGAIAQDDGSAKESNDDASHGGKGAAKKKTRGTGKPRGRPRTRPRPGEIIRRVKPPPIAPANFPGMQEYLAQKMAEWKATQAGIAADDNRVVTAFGSALLPGDHE